MSFRSDADLTKEDRDRLKASPIRYDAQPEQIYKKYTRHGMKGTPEYNTWVGMLARCRNLKATGYKNWGGRGITVCKRWHSFINFFKDMGERPKRAVLERNDNDLGYCPENCSWKSWKKQTNNRRSVSCEQSGSLPAILRVDRYLSQITNISLH